MTAGELARLLVFAGVGLIVLGLLVRIGAPLGLGRLPGDVRWESGNVRVFAPIMTCVLLSLALTLLLNLFTRR